MANHNKGVLPPAFGSGGMLDLRLAGPEQPGTFTKHRLFSSKSSRRVPTMRLPMTSGSCKVVHKNSGVNSTGEGEDDSDDEDDSNGVSDALPRLLANADLVKAVSETQMAATIQKYALEEQVSEVLRIFSVLVEPPRNLDLDAIEGLPEYLSKLRDWVLRLPVNGVRRVANHCWWIIMGAFV